MMDRLVGFVLSIGLSTSIGCAVPPVDVDPTAADLDLLSRAVAETAKMSRLPVPVVVEIEGGTGDTIGVGACDRFEWQRFRSFCEWLSLREPIIRYNVPTITSDSGSEYPLPSAIDRSIHNLFLDSERAAPTGDSDPLIVTVRVQVSSGDRSISGQVRVRIACAMDVEFELAGGRYLLHSVALRGEGIGPVPWRSGDPGLAVANPAYQAMASVVELVSEQLDSERFRSLLSRSISTGYYCPYCDRYRDQDEDAANAKNCGKVGHADFLRRTRFQPPAKVIE